MKNQDDVGHWGNQYNWLLTKYTNTIYWLSLGKRFHGLAK